MIYALLRRNLTLSISRNLTSPGESRVCFSLSVLNFSTSRDSKPLNTPSVYELLVHKHKLSPVLASRVASVLPLLKPEKCDSILLYFKEIGITKSQIERAVNYKPTLFSVDPDRIMKPKIRIFQDMEFSVKDIAYIISKEPGILHASANKKISRGLVVLRDVLGSKEEVVKVLRKCGWLLMTDLETNMVPNIKFLNSCGIDMGQIAVLCNSFTRVLLYKPESLKKCVDKVEEMGVDRSSRMFVYAVGAYGSMKNGTWELKLQAFRNTLQLSENDILRIVKQNPLVLTVSEDKIKKVKEFLLATGKYDTSCIVKHPKSLMYSIEQRYNPRFEILGILEKRHLIKRWPSLAVMYQMTDDMFYKKFVCPYLNEVGDVYLAHKGKNMPAAEEQD